MKAILHCQRASQQFLPQKQAKRQMSNKAKRKKKMLFVNLSRAEKNPTRQYLSEKAMRCYIFCFISSLTIKWGSHSLTAVLLS